MISLSGIVKSVRCVAFIALCAASAFGTSVVDVSVSGDALQKITGWGISPSEVYYDTLVNKPSAIRRLFGELHASHAKVVITANCYDRQKDDGSLDEAVLYSSLLPQIQNISKYGLIGYFSTVDSPPLTFKRFLSPDGRQDYHLNELLEERELDYAYYIVSVMRYLRDRGLPLPVAHSIQTSASVAISRPPCCPYSPRKLVRVARITRRALDDAGFQGIALIGPDFDHYAGLVDSLALMAEAETSPIGRIFGVLGYQPGFEALRESGSMSAAAARALREQTSGGREVWMTGWSCPAARTDDDVCLATAERLCGDLQHFGVSCWFFGGGYTVDQSGQALVFGDGEVSLTFEMLRQLWADVRPGARVRKLRLLRVNQDDPLDILKATGICFEADGTRVYLLTNSSSLPTSFRIREQFASPLKCWFSRKNGAEVTNRGGGVMPTILIPSNAVAIIRVEK